MDTHHFSQFGTWLQARRKSLGLSQIRLAQLVHYSVVSIRKFEGGSRRPTKDMAYQLAQALEIPERYLPAFILSARTGLVEQSLQGWSTHAHSFTPEASYQTQTTVTTTVTTQSFRQSITPTSQIYGRESEIRDLNHLLHQPIMRLITLLGPPGVGKTRLALEILNQAKPEDWPDGKFFVPLANIDHATLIPEMIAATMGIREANTRKWHETQPIQAVFNFLHNKQLLLVLDNFEHILDGTSFVVQLMAAAPHVKLIVTSRANLHVAGEQAFPINALDVGSLGTSIKIATASTTLATHTTNQLIHAQNNPAVALFTARAQACRPSFRLTEQNLAVVIDLCRRLDGLPLALELAAVRLKLQTPEELLTQISAHSTQSKAITSSHTSPDSPSPNPHTEPAPTVSKTLPLLDKGLKTLANRHQTLTEAIAWSYSLLPEVIQGVFIWLSIFQAGFTRDAALAVAHTSLDVLEHLTDQSLIQVQVLGDGSIRLYMLEVMREFALNKGTEQHMLEDMCQQHATYFDHLMAQAYVGMRGRDHEAWFERVQAEVPNIRMALHWCIEHDPKTGLRIALNLIYFWFVTGSGVEGRDWVRQLLETSEGRDDLASDRALLLCKSVWLDNPVPPEILLEQVEFFKQQGDLANSALALEVLGLRLKNTDPKRGSNYLYRAKAVFDARCDHWHSAMVRTMLSICLYSIGQYTTCEKFLKEAIEIQTKLQDQRALVRTQNQFGWIAYARGNYWQAMALAKAAVPLNEQFRDPQGLLDVLANLTFAALELGEMKTAHKGIEDGLRVIKESGHEVFHALFLHAASILAWRERRWHDAMQFAHHSLALAQQHDQCDYLWFILIHMAKIGVELGFRADIQANITFMVNELKVNKMMADIVTCISTIRCESAAMEYQFPRAYQVMMAEILQCASDVLSFQAFAHAQAGGMSATTNEMVHKTQLCVEQWLTLSPS